jgi:2-phosphoglycerate kinase
MTTGAQAHQRPRTVLLLGGSPGAGKTAAAREIGLALGISWAQADDFRLALQRATAPQQYPGLHYFVQTKDVWRQPPEALVARLIAVGRTVSYALEVVVASHALLDSPLVLEGDGILPAMAAQRTFAGEAVAEKVRAVFVYEPDEPAIMDAMRVRGRGFEGHTPEEQRTQARMRWLYSEWLRAEAERHGLPVVLSRPQEALAARILAALAPPKATASGEGA